MHGFSSGIGRVIRHAAVLMCGWDRLRTTVFAETESPSRNSDISVDEFACLSLCRRLAVCVFVSVYL